MENKEILEQASKEFANSKKWMDKGAESWVEHTFIEGAKWQQERMYSEEEVLEIFKQAQLCSVKADGVYFKYETFEQFKKK